MFNNPDFTLVIILMTSIRSSIADTLGGCYFDIVVVLKPSIFLFSSFFTLRFIVMSIFVHSLLLNSNFFQILVQSVLDNCYVLGV